MFSTVNTSNSQVNCLNTPFTVTTYNTTATLHDLPSTMGRTTAAITPSSILPGVDVVIYEGLDEQ